ncbi:MULTISPECIES: hypothetical protein [unclassified Ruegeria]|uniref:hypothetical protein n=1 Tax=unclassified Ruegeria TaxID=2625375 RepID=UPI001488F72A|nr:MULTISPECIES: hypothetical protein [unclassified Ruegeria]NOE43664.1 hypothetical protein [Ruegeria sp. HKCCD7319]
MPRRSAAILGGQLIAKDDNYPEVRFFHWLGARTSEQVGQIKPSVCALVWLANPAIGKTREN